MNTIKNLFTTKLVAVITLLFLASLGVYFTSTRGYFRLLKVYAAQSTVVPVTVVLAESSIDDQGLEIKQKQTQAVRRDGSTAIAYTAVDPKSGEEHIIQTRIVAADRLIVDTLDEVKGKSTRRAESTSFAFYHLGARRVASGNCVKTAGGDDMELRAQESLLGTESIQGFRAAKVATRSPEMLSWYALDYGCALIGQEIRYQTADPEVKGRLISGVSTKRLISLKAGEPSSELFEIPAGYEEMSPSDLRKKLNKKLTGEAKDCNPAASALDDAKYYAQRP